MSPKTIVLSLSLIMAGFTYYGFSVVSKTHEDFEKSSDHFNTVTNVLSPMFDSCAIAIVDTQVKLSHNQMDFLGFCKIIEKTKKDLKTNLQKYNEQKDILEQNNYTDLENHIKKVNIYLDKLILACEKRDQKAIYKMLDSGEMYAVVDPTTKLINKILDEKLIFAEASKDHAFKVLAKFKNYLIFQLTLISVISIAVLLPKKKKVRVKKAI